MSMPRLSRLKAEEIAGISEIDPTNDTHVAALYQALRESDAESLLRWLDAGLDPNWQGEDGESLLAASLSGSSYSKMRCAELLLARGADPNGGSTPALFYATTEPAISFLLQAGANPDVTWAADGKRPSKLDTVLEREGKRTGEPARYSHRIETIRFWREKRRRKPKPIATRDFALFLVRQAVRLDAHWTTFGIASEAPVADVKEAVENWIQGCFDTFDFVGFDEGWLPAERETTWRIWTRKKPDGSWMDRGGYVALYLGEDPPCTLAAYLAERERSELAIVVPEPRRDLTSDSRVQCRSDSL